MKRGTQHRRGGFTLIELLVVIAIIAILAGILFPVFLGAKSMAKTSACQSNLKQFVFAYKMYAEDFNGMFPFLPGQDQKYLHYTQEVLFFQGYLRSRATYHCPSDSSHPNNQKFYDEFGADGKMKWGINRDHSLSYLPYLYLPGRAHVNSDPWNILMRTGLGSSLYCIVPARMWPMWVGTVYGTSLAIPG
jgi:prepilin-type N-terminal cleavage/methylation domain-containing protein